MLWMKAADAAKHWCGGINPKLLYAGVKTGKLKAVRMAGRNLLFSEQFCDEWLLGSASKDQATPIAMPARRRA